ncbi:MAG TPA: NAD(P)-dependent alcohol dehydrogenase [Flavobacteriales bacterium]|nr:NAD(P)-dependent alcohol dehydrogenase [Flavobacteriales bacterium]
MKYSATVPTRMQAWTYRRYGPPDVLQREELPVPTPGPKDILVRVHATTVNRTDCGFRSAEYVISRLFSGLFRPKRPVLGCEFAGEVVAVGEQVDRFKVGDKVFGYDDQRFGAYAEYMVTAADGGAALLPQGWSYPEAAPLTEGIHYAWCDLKAADIGPGSRVLVYGATGAIGSGAVQLAVSLGAEVTAVCTTPHVERIKALGAHKVIDRNTTDFRTEPGSFDLVFDAVGKSRFKHCRHLLTPNGCYISTELGPRSENVFLAMVGGLRKGPRVRFPLPTISQADVEHFRSMAEAGTLRPLIDRVVGFKELVEATRYVETGQKIGNVVVTIG